MITKDMVIDLIQILPDRQIQIREIRRVLEDGVVIATGAYHRFVLDPGSDTLQKIAETFEPDLVNAITALWTPTVIAARKQFIAEQEAIRLVKLAEAQVASPLAKLGQGSK